MPQAVQSPILLQRYLAVHSHQQYDAGCRGPALCQHRAKSGQYSDITAIERTAFTVVYSASSLTLLMLTSRAQELDGRIESKQSIREQEDRKQVNMQVVK